MTATNTALAKAIEEHGKPFAIFYEYQPNENDLETVIESFKEAYQGEHESLADYAEEWFKDAGMMPENDMPELLKNNIDWEGIGKELEIGGDIWTHRDGGTLYVFNNI